MPAPPPKPKPWTVRELVDHYRAKETPKKKGIVQENDKLNRMLRTCGFSDRVAIEITRRGAIHWFDDRLEQRRFEQRKRPWKGKVQPKIKAGTARKEKDLWHRIFKLAINKEWGGFTVEMLNPFRDIEAPPGSDVKRNRTIKDTTRQRGS